VCLFELGLLVELFLTRGSLMSSTKSAPKAKSVWVAGSRNLGLQGRDGDK
jgi:hypothetical protein